MWTAAVAFYAPKRPPSVHAIERHLSLPKLTAALTRHRAAPDKLEAPGWAPHVLSMPYRRLANVQAVSCLVYDYDDGTSIEQAREVWAPWFHVMHTSWSHTPEAHKFRIVLPLEEPCPADHYPETWAHYAQRAGQVDAQCKDASRLYFLPSSPSGVGVSYVHDGPLLDPRPWPEPAPLPRPPIRDTRGKLGPRTSWDDLKTSEGRLTAAVAAGAEVAEWRGQRVARHATCPSCGRASVFWMIDDFTSAKARCSHRNSCGWSGWLDEVQGG